MFLFKNISQITRKADKERDNKNWLAAANLYIQAAKSFGNTKKRFRALIQAGNCLKESQNYTEALKIYDQAVKINSRDSDLHLQRGHLFKRMKQLGDAINSYQLSYKYDPKNKDASSELSQIGGVQNFDEILQRKDIVTSSAKIIWLDVSDFMQYASCNNSLSGIQRVIANLALYIEHINIPGYHIIPVIPDYNEKKILSIPLGLFIKLVSEFDKLNVDGNKLNKYIVEINNNRTDVTPKTGDILVIAGAFWIYPNYDAIIEFRKTGMRFGLFLHDLIQVRMPEYVEKAAHDQFVIQFSDALDLVDFVLTNSEYVANDLRSYISEYKNYEIPVKAVVLPTELRGHIEGNIPQDPDILYVSKTEYVLCVSTIEIRKNHRLLVKCWEKLREEFGEDTPNLVFIGKWGWEIDNLRDYLNERGYIGDWLFIFNGISDSEMEYLYKHSLFSVYPSFAEGFGLPIGESLVYKKPCIASNTTSMPEVGKDFVRYIDPFDWEASYAVIREPIADREDLKRWQEYIEKNFSPKTWKQFCNEFYYAVVSFSESLSMKGSHPLCPIPEGKLILGGLHDILNMSRYNEKILTFRAARYEGWHPANHWGVWMKKRRAVLEFSANCVPGTEIIIFLRLHREANRDSDPLALINGGMGDFAFRLSQHPTIYRLMGRVNSDGKINIKILARGKFPSNNEFIGLSGITYCRSNDTDILLKTYESISPIGQIPGDINYVTTSPVELL